MVAEVPAPTYEVTVDGWEEGIEDEAGLWNGDRSPRNDYTSHKDSMWEFSEMGVLPVILHFNRMFPYKPSILGYPNLRNHPYNRIYKWHIELISNKKHHLLRNIFWKELGIQQTSWYKVWIEWY